MEITLAKSKQIASAITSELPAKSEDSPIMLTHVPIDSRAKAAKNTKRINDISVCKGYRFI